VLAGSRLEEEAVLIGELLEADPVLRENVLLTEGDEVGAVEEAEPRAVAGDDCFWGVGVGYGWRSW
jgi:hypothetical protein